MSSAGTDDAGMGGDDFEAEADVVRQQHFDLDGKAELDVLLGAGRVLVHLSDEPGVHVEVRGDRTPNPQWAQSLSGMLDWLGQQFGKRGGFGQHGGGFDWARDFASGFGGFGQGGSGRGGPFGPGGFGPGGFGRGGFGQGGFGPGGFGQGGHDPRGFGYDDEQEEREEFAGRRPRNPFESGQWAAGWSGASAAEAARQCTIEQSGNRVLVHSGAQGPARLSPLEVSVRAPLGSRVSVQAGAADVEVSGPAGRVQIKSGAGEIAVEHADAPSRVHTGSGELRLGAMPAGVSVRSGSGDVRIDSIGAGSSISTGTGEVSIGTVNGDLTVRTGSGDLAVREAASGRVALVTGSGDIRVGVAEGKTASVDLFSRQGTAHSDLPVADTPPERTGERESSGAQPVLSVRARSDHGDVLVTSAVSAAR